MEVESVIRAAFSEVEIDEALLSDVEAITAIHHQLGLESPDEAFQSIPFLMIGQWRHRHGGHFPDAEYLVHFFYLATLMLCPEGPPPHPKLYGSEKTDQRLAIDVLDLCTPEQIGAIVHWVKALYVDWIAHFEEPDLYDPNSPDSDDEYAPLIRCLSARASIPLPE